MLIMCAAASDRLQRLPCLVAISTACVVTMFCMTSCIFVVQLEERDGHYVIVTKENWTIAQIAKELEHGCTAEEILMLNKSNPSCAGAEKKNAKFRAGTEVWLPTAAYCGYVLDAKVAQAEAEAQAKVIDANRKAEAARAEAVRARAETETAAALTPAVTRARRATRRSARASPSCKAHDARPWNTRWRCSRRPKVTHVPISI